jgi:hypothetical protein
MCSDRLVTRSSPGIPAPSDEAGKPGEDARLVPSLGGDGLAALPSGKLEGGFSPQVVEALKKSACAVPFPRSTTHCILPCPRDLLVREEEGTRSIFPLRPPAAGTARSRGVGFWRRDESPEGIVPTFLVGPERATISNPPRFLPSGPWRRPFNARCRKGLDCGGGKSEARGERAFSPPSAGTLARMCP